MNLPEALALLQRFEALRTVPIGELCSLSVRLVPQLRWEVHVSERAFRAVCAAERVPYVCKPHLSLIGEEIIGHTWIIEPAPDLVVKCYKSGPVAKLGPAA